MYLGGIFSLASDFNWLTLISFHGNPRKNWWIGMNWNEIILNLGDKASLEFSFPEHFLYILIYVPFCNTNNLLEIASICFLDLISGFCLSKCIWSSWEDLCNFSCKLILTVPEVSSDRESFIGHIILGWVNGIGA